MKKIIILPFLLATTFAVISFTSPEKSERNKVTYAFVTDTEYDKALDAHKPLDEPDNDGYVDITTNIVSINCNAGPATIESQYIRHYAAEEKTENRDRAFIGSDLTRAWVYDSYDKALASRRDWMAKSSAKYKRRVEKFYVTCN